MAINIDRSLRLPDGEYLPETGSKTGICIHHTVGGSAKSTFHWWTKDRTKQGKRLKVGTAFIIERDGTVFEVFDPAAWAFQFGLRWPVTKKLKFEKRFIGIEIASEGALTESDGRLYCFDRVSDKTLKPRNETFDYGKDFRGYRHFDKYEEPQVDALVDLINELCSRFRIKKQVPDGLFDFYGDRLADFHGIIGHSMVRKDKSDPLPDKSLWDRIINECGVTPIEVGASNPRVGGKMTDQEIEALFEHNAQQIDQMNVSAGSVVSALISELERNGRNTYIRLRNPAPRGHTVNYEFVQGGKALIARAARALGFKSVTDSQLEVHGGRD